MRGKAGKHQRLNWSSGLIPTSGKGKVTCVKAENNLLQREKEEKGTISVYHRIK